MTKKKRAWLIIGTIFVWLSIILASCGTLEDVYNNFCCLPSLIIFPLVILLKVWK
jgi:hypothetical protein